MIDYDNDFEEMTVWCDKCSASIDFEGEWMECIEELKKEKWLIRRDEFGEWEHICPVCRST